ncbi:MAG TPA: efflux RND transporter periplasmic adaptor subunit [Micropepsaceae bacterium]
MRRAYWTRRRLAAAIVFTVLLLGMILWWPFGSSQPTIVYGVAKAARTTVEATVHSTGTLEPRNPVDIVAPASGRLQSLAVKNGDRVSKGQVLARLVSETARADLLSVQAELAARQADLARSQIDIAEARAALMRARNDMRPGTADAAEARLARVSANGDEARKLVQAAQQSVASSRNVLASLDIRAPFDGTVLKIGYDPSSDVRAVSRGQPLLTMVADLSELNVTTAFPENALGALRAGERAGFTVPAYPQRTFSAALTALDLWPERQIRDGRQVVTYRGTLAAANPGDMLRPGMSASIAIIAAESKNVLTVPNGALAFAPPPKIESRFAPMKQPAGAAHFGRVWVLANGKPEPRDIALGLSDGRVTQVVSGSLREGDNIITSAVITKRGGQS